jgi:hypothetical protein
MAVAARPDPAKPSRSLRWSGVESSGHAALNTETYYHRLSPPQGFAFQRIYTDDRSARAGTGHEQESARGAYYRVRRITPQSCDMRPRATPRIRQ